MSELNPTQNLAQVIDALQNTAQPFPSRLMHRLSDLSSKDIRELSRIWPEVDLKLKQGLLKDLEELAENDTLVNFDDFALSVIGDPDPSIRVLAIRLLSECDATRLLPVMTDMMMGDPEETVRAAAAAHLGLFILRGELDDLQDTLRIANFQNLMDVANGHDLPSVRRRALESLGYSSNPKVHPLIQQAFDSNDIQWRASALYAMGRSADEKWAPQVTSSLDSPDLEVQYEAVRAAGELELTDTADKLLAILDDELEPSDLRLAVIWALSQIGGEEAKSKLEQLMDESQDDEEIEMLDKALENIELNGLSGGLDLLDIEPPSGSENLTDTSEKEE